MTEPKPKGDGCLISQLQIGLHASTREMQSAVNLFGPRKCRRLQRLPRSIARPAPHPRQIPCGSIKNAGRNSAFQAVSGGPAFGLIQTPIGHWLRIDHRFGKRPMLRLHRAAFLARNLFQSNK